MSCFLNDWSLKLLASNDIMYIETVLPSGNYQSHIPSMNIAPGHLMLFLLVSSELLSDSAYMS